MTMTTSVYLRFIVGNLDDFAHVGLFKLIL